MIGCGFTRERACGVALLLGLFAAPPQTSASSFTVNPTQIHLGGRTLSALLTLRNEGPTPLRFQLSVFGWDQNARGEMQLHPTQDIVFFPALLTLGPSEERRIRVGAATRSGPVERTYRIFVEELPPDSTERQGAVRMLTKMGIPIFLRPAKVIAEGGLDDLQLGDGRFTFRLRNAGTVHFVPQTVRVRAFGPRKDVVFDRQLDGWYILAGGSRVYDLSVPQSECPHVRSLSVEVRIGSSTLSEQLDAHPSACSP